jgi:hypothetical protein
VLVASMIIRLGAMIVRVMYDIYGKFCGLRHVTDISNVLEDTIHLLDEPYPARLHPTEAMIWL